MDSLNAPAEAQVGWDESLLGCDARLECYIQNMERLV